METTNINSITPARSYEEQDDSNFDYDKFEQYLDNIEEQLSPWNMLEEIDETVDQVENELNSYNSEIISSSEEIKRKLAITTLEIYNLNLLAKDADFNVRTLALCNEAVSSATLNQAVEDASDGDKFTMMVVANNPNTSPSTLNRIFDLAGNEKEVQIAILNNPNCDDILKFKVTSAMEQAGKRNK